jgi:hypothetical protein
MHPQRHTPFETWQADVMRTLVDAGPLATSYFSATERHQESLRMASDAQAGADATRRGPGAHVTSFRRHVIGVFCAVRISLQALRSKPAMRRSVSGTASVR